MNDAVLSINATMGKGASEKAEGLEAKFKASAKAVIDGNWMEASDDALFRAAVGGVMLDVGKDSQEYQTLKNTIEQIQKFSAFLAAATRGLKVEIPDVDEVETVPLMKWWKEVKV